MSMFTLYPKEMISGMRDGTKIMSEQFVMAFAPVRSKPKRTYSVLDDDEDESGKAAAFMFRLSRNAPDKWGDLRKRLAQDLGDARNDIPDGMIVTGNIPVDRGHPEHAANVALFNPRPSASAGERANPPLWGALISAPSEGANLKCVPP